ncbi:uncharacterized protein [Dermacentor albipictus]|uniref:uncharacterized protein isoform X2 n=1 Tax=Dermacentor albipictus TaxID=60249 RepID=UPI0038FCE87B
MGTVKSSEGHCANAFDNGLLSDVCRNSELKRLREQNGFQEAPRRPMSLKCAQVESSREHRYPQWPPVAQKKDRQPRVASIAFQ